MYFTQIGATEPSYKATIKEKKEKKGEKIMKKSNESIRLMMGMYGISQMDLAKRIGISRESMCKWLADDLSAERKERILKAISEIRGVEQNGER